MPYALPNLELNGLKTIKQKLCVGTQLDQFNIIDPS
jgi:hypothetical protein